MATRKAVPWNRARRAARLALVLIAGAALPAPAFAQATKLADDRCRFDQGGRSWQVTIPSKGEPVRGLFVNGNPGTGDLLGWTTNPFFRTYFAARFGFGMVASKGVEGSSTYGSFASVILKAIEECGKALGHPELAWAPLIPAGNSSGATNAWGLTNAAPARVLAFALNIPGNTLNPGTPNEAALKIPGIMVFGEADRGNLASSNGAMVRNARSKGALWSKIEMEGVGHDNRRSWHLFHAFFEKVIALRMPADADPTKGPVALRPVAEDQGFLADDATWSSGLTKYASYAAFGGDKRGPNTSWVLDEDMAFLHQAYSSRGRPFDLTTADLPAGSDGGTITPLELNTNIVYRNFNATVELTGTAKQTGWSKIELFVGAKKLAEVTGGGATFKFTVPVNADPPAVWPFSVRGTLSGGVRPSQMLSVLVKPHTGQPAPGAGGAGGMAGMGGAGGSMGGAGGMPVEKPGAGGTSNVAGAGGRAGAAGGRGGSGGGPAQDPGDGNGGTDEPNEEPEASTGTASGCGYGGRAPTSWLPLAVVAAVLLARRRRPS